MKAQLDKQREKEVHLLNMEQMKPPYWETRHVDFCPVKVTNAITNHPPYLACPRPYKTSSTIWTEPPSLPPWQLQPILQPLSGE